jgi:hypothetical protein
VSQVPLWVPIASLFIGPALTAAFANYFFQRKLHDYEAKLEDRSRRRLELEQYVANYQVALRESYVLIFEKGQAAGPVELLKLDHEAIDMVMKPFRQRERLLTAATKRSLLAVANHLYAFLPSLSEAEAISSPAIVDRFRSTRIAYFSKVQQAGDALQHELELY